MKETILIVPLKEQLDSIDKRFGRKIYNGFYQSRLNIEIGMWQKGKAVLDFRGVNSSITYYQLEKQTDRSQESLKEWNDLYEKYREYDKFLKKYAEPRAKAWTGKALKGPRPTLLEDRSEETSYSKLTLQELVNMKIEPDSTQDITSAIAELPTEQQKEYREYRATMDQLLITARKITKIVDRSTDIREVTQCRDMLLLLTQIFAEDLLRWEARIGELLLAKEPKNK